MSPQAVADPEDLDRFAQMLREFNNDLLSSSNRLRAQFSHLGETWRDQEHQKFAQEFEQTMRVIDMFIRSSEVQIPVLKRKAHHLRNYLHQR